MLNSAAGVMLPSPIAPPISTISLIRGTTSGAFCIAAAMLVSGPVGQSMTVPAGRTRRISMIASTACAGAGGMRGSGRSAPSSPVSPWMYSAVTRSRTRGRAQPAWTGRSKRPASSTTWRAFFSVSASGTLPATVVTASTSNSSGEASASRSASASSWPGSQSMMMGRGATGQLARGLGARSGDRLARLSVVGRVLDREADLDHDLIVGDPTGVDVTARLHHLEPAQAVQGLGRPTDGVLDRVLDAALGGARQLDHLVDVVVRHGSCLR